MGQGMDEKAGEVCIAEPGQSGSGGVLTAVWVPVGQCAPACDAAVC